MRVFLIGVPQRLGGGNQEAGDTALLWRRAGIEVSCLYFTRCKCGKPNFAPVESNPWVSRLREAGVEFVPGESGKLRDVPGLAGATLVSFCNSHATHNWPEMAAMGCRLIWSPCMCYTTPAEHEAFLAAPPSVVHFQSEYQTKCVWPEYAALGCKEYAVIRGAFEPLPFSPLPHEPGEPFVVGRLARPSRLKWSPYLWDMLAEVRRNGVDVRALCMGWDQTITDHCGKSPSWATCLAPDSISSREFLSRCHALICPNWAVFENWPRVGLEAMSAGVLLIVDDSGGWREMVDATSGVRCASIKDYPAAIIEMANNEQYRRSLITGGAEMVAAIANQVAIGQEWARIF